MSWVLTLGDCARKLLAPLLASNRMFKDTNLQAALPCAACL